MFRAIIILIILANLIHNSYAQSILVYDTDNGSYSNIITQTLKEIESCSGNYIFDKVINFNDITIENQINEEFNSQINFAARGKVEFEPKDNVEIKNDISKLDTIDYLLTHTKLNKLHSIRLFKITKPLIIQNYSMHSIELSLLDFVEFKYNAHDKYLINYENFGTEIKTQLFYDCKNIKLTNLKEIRNDTMFTFSSVVVQKTNKNTKLLINGIEEIFNTLIDIPRGENEVKIIYTSSIHKDTINILLIGLDTSIFHKSIVNEVVNMPFQKSLFKSSPIEILPTIKNLVSNPLEISTSKSELIVKDNYLPSKKELAYHFPKKDFSDLEFRPNIVFDLEIDTFKSRLNILLEKSPEHSLLSNSLSIHTKNKYGISLDTLQVDYNYYHFKPFSINFHLFKTNRGVWNKKYANPIDNEIVKSKLISFFGLSTNLFIYNNFGIGLGIFNAIPIKGYSRSSNSQYIYNINKTKSLFEFKLTYSDFIEETSMGYSIKVNLFRVHDKLYSSTYNIDETQNSLGVSVQSSLDFYKSIPFFVSLEIPVYSGSNLSNLIPDESDNIKFNNIYNIAFSIGFRFNILKSSETYKKTLRARKIYKKRICCAEKKLKKTQDNKR